MENKDKLMIITGTTIIKSAGILSVIIGVCMILLNLFNFNAENICVAIALILAGVYLFFFNEIWNKIFN